MARKKYYLTIDTETATLPCVNYLNLTPEEKKKIAIAKPLVYDIGWTITDRLGNEIKRTHFLVQETFFVPQVFNTAYYKDKRPLYMEMYKKGEIDAKPWNEIIEKHLLPDLREIDVACAYNACFDFKKSIPYTERYIKALYSEDYQNWEDMQVKTIKNILGGEDESKNPDYLEPIFTLRNEDFKICDLWYLSCIRLLNNNKYRDYCLENKLLTNSGLYFKSSAETAFQFVTKDFNFIEEHTALADALIEAQLLTKILKKGKVEGEMGCFSFKELGYTYEYVETRGKRKYKGVVKEQIEIYLDTKDKSTAYTSRLENILCRLDE